MSTEQSAGQWEVPVEIDGYKARLFLRSNILAECERIKTAAKVLLEEVKKTADDEKAADIRVLEFLKDSIIRLLGDAEANKVFERQPFEIANLTAVLCCLISEIGASLGSVDYEDKID